jgi:hypothetical protein
MGVLGRQTVSQAKFLTELRADSSGGVSGGLDPRLYMDWFTFVAFMRALDDGVVEGPSVEDVTGIGGLARRVSR